MDGVADIAPEIRLEVLLDEGSRLVVLREPFGPATLDGPGAVRFADGDVALLPDRTRITLTVANTSERPVRVSSHFPFHETNAKLRFDREAARGFRLDLPAGDSIRWAPDESRTSSSSHTRVRTGPMPDRYTRSEHALRHGPTVGDRVRLGDTDLWIRIERDLTEPADQVLWGYAKNFRSRMGQHDRATSESELDAVVAGAIVVDPLLGIIKADIGIKDGRVVGIGRAGNPDITDGVDLTIGPGTWPIPCHGLIVTPGAIDSHVHLLTPRLVPVALSAGVTTLITAGFEEPAWRMLRTLEAFERLPVNLGLQASARTDVAGFADDVIASGAIGLKVHEDWGASARIIDAALTTAEVFDIAVCMHTDGLNESGELEDTVAAIDGRTIHAYHVEGVGGGHIPDLIGIVREPNVICSSTTPGLPYARATAAEHLDMILIVHEGNPGARRRSRRRARADPTGDDNSGPGSQSSATAPTTPSPTTGAARTAPARLGRHQRRRQRLGPRLGRHQRRQSGPRLGRRRERGRLGWPRIRRLTPAPRSSPRPRLQRPGTSPCSPTSCSPAADGEQPARGRQRHRPRGRACRARLGDPGRARAARHRHEPVLSPRRVLVQLARGSSAALLVVGVVGTLAARQLAEREAVNDAATMADVLAEAVVEPALTDAPGRRRPGGHRGLRPGGPRPAAERPADRARQAVERPGQGALRRREPAHRPHLPARARSSARR